MSLNEYIAKLQALRNEHGDLECVDSYGDSIGEPEVNDEDGAGNIVAVLADKA